MKYILISGEIKDLFITKGYENLAIHDKNKNLIGATSIIAAAIGESTSSTILASSIGDAEVDMEYFTCNVEGIKLTGRFHKVGFKDGETIEFIVEMYHGIGEVHGARNPAQRLIWTLPYQTRGHVAQKRNNISSSITISTISALPGVLLYYYNEPRSLIACWENFIGIFLIGFLIMLFVNILVRFPFYHFSKEATKIFTTYGFENPEMIDLQKHHKFADIKYYKEIGQIRPWEVIPWKYRYK